MAGRRQAAQLEVHELLNVAGAAFIAAVGQ
jgi:hypothetical protein